MAQLSNGLNVESIDTMFGNPLPATSAPPKNFIVRVGMMMQPKSKEPDREFTQLYSMDPAQKIRAAVNMPLCYLGGAQTMDNVNRIMDNGFETLGLGRALIFDPNLINALQSGSLRNSGCTACNQCVTLMYTPGGTACVEEGGHKGHDPALNIIPATAA